MLFNAKCNVLVNLVPFRLRYPRNVEEAADAAIIPVMSKNPSSLWDEGRRRLYSWLLPHQKHPFACLLNKPSPLLSLHPFHSNNTVWYIACVYLHTVSKAHRPKWKPQSNYQPRKARLHRKRGRKVGRFTEVSHTHKKVINPASCNFWAIR